MIIYSRNNKLQDGGKENAITIKKPKAKQKGRGNYLDYPLMLLPWKTGNLYSRKSGQEIS